jgi:hypothetical protein
MEQSPYRPVTETSLACISIAFAVLNFGFLLIEFLNTSQAAGVSLWALLLNSVLLFVGYLSLRLRPKSCAQQLAAGWFFVPIAGLANQSDTAFFLALSWPIILYVYFAVIMLIWAITLAIKQSRNEQREAR